MASTTELFWRMVRDLKSLDKNTKYKEIQIIKYRTMTPLRFSKNAESILLGGIGIEYCLVGSELILSELYRGNIDLTHIFS